MYNYRRGRTERVVDSALSGTVSVHLLGGGALPMYRAKAIRSVGLPDRSLFFGFEELEYGLRFVADGWRLLVDGDEWRRLREETDRSSLTRRDLRSSGSHASWRNYYSTRNQIIIARRFGGAAAVMLSSIDGLARAVRSILRRKHRGNVVMIGRGLIDGWSSRTGRVVEPPLAK